MSLYSLQFSPAAVRQFKKLERQIQLQITSAVDELGMSPRPSGTKKLSGKENIYRIRIGNYRILYQINDSSKTITVATIGHRREIYR